jgi:Flp pilus assembly CpaF family ATPase
MNDWTGYDYLAARLERQPQGYLLTAQQRGDLRRYLLRTLPPATFNPGEMGHGEAIRAAIAQALREKVLVDVTLSPDPSTVSRLYAETVGLGPLDALLADETVTSVTANGPGLLMVERLDRSGVSFVPGFDTGDSLLRAMDALAQRAGRSLTPAEPVIDLVWDDPDGPATRVHLNLLGRKAPFLALRRGRRQAFSLGHYVAGGRMSGEMAAFLAEAVRAGVSIVVTGMPGSGKTALLEALLHLTTPAQGHVVLIEDDPEVNVGGLTHVSAFQVPRPRPGQEAPVGFLGLVLASLRMNCRSILVCGEVRGAEAGAIIAVMPSYRAVWMTVHGTSPVDGLERLVAAAQMGGTRPPSPFSGGRQEQLVRRNLAAGLQLIVQMDRLADDRIVIAGVYWLEGLGDGSQRSALPAPLRQWRVLGGAGESTTAQSLHPGEGWGLMPIFQVRQQVEAGELIVDWQTEPGFRWPDEVAARLAMAELQAGSLDEVTFQAELATAQAALEGNQVVEASRRLSNLYGLAPGEQGRQAVLRLLRQALLAQPARWERLLEDALEMKTQVEHLLERRDWMQAAQILDTGGQDPEMDVALEQLGIEALRAQVAAGMEALADLATAEDRVASLAEAGQHWQALSTLAGLPLEKLPAETAIHVVGMQAEQLNALRIRADAGQEDVERVARATLRLLPQMYEDLRAWAERHVDGARQPEVEVPPDTVPKRMLISSPADDDERQALYTQACLALSAGDRVQARQLLQQVGGYRAAQRLLQNMEE